MSKKYPVRKAGFIKKLHLDFIIWDFLRSYKNQIGDNLELMLDATNIIAACINYRIDLRCTVGVKGEFFTASLRDYISHLKMLNNTMIQTSDIFSWDKNRSQKIELFKWYTVNSQECPAHEQLLIEVNEQLQIFQDLVIQDKQHWNDVGAYNSLMYIANDTSELIKLLDRAL
ncbi:hypothetical protein [Vibrio phage BONAISHI]|nr:hypothetical protein [Vibrio phage BONAISHI]